MTIHRVGGVLKREGMAGSRGASVAALEGKGYLSKAGTKLNCSQETDLKTLEKWTPLDTTLAHTKS